MCVCVCVCMCVCVCPYVCVYMHACVLCVCACTHNLCAKINGYIAKYNNTVHAHVRICMYYVYTQGLQTVIVHI